VALLVLLVLEAPLHLVIQLVQVVLLVLEDLLVLVDLAVLEDLLVPAVLEFVSQMRLL
jgi:hypothetical protein